MKAIWKGNLTIALISIPVKLYPAIKRKTIQLHLLHRECSTPLKYERYCPVCNRDVEWSEVIHGYEYEKDRYVTITDEELDSIFYEESKSIKILSFVSLKEVDPIFFDTTYYLAPEEGGQEAYILLRRVMETTERVGLVRLVLRGREHMGILRVYQGVLAIHTVHYLNEIVRPDFIDLPEDVGIDRKTLTLARELVKGYSASFDMTAFHDRSTEALMELIDKKIAGKEITVKPAKEVQKVVSLMDALKKSIAATEMKKKRRKAAG